MSQKPQARMNLLSSVTTKQLDFILILWLKLSPKCRLTWWPMELETTASTGSIERGRLVPVEAPPPPPPPPVTPDPAADDCGDSE